MTLCEIIKETQRFVFVLLHLQRQTFNCAIFIYLLFFFWISFAMLPLAWHGNSNWFLITTFMLYNSCWHCCHNQCAANISAIDMAKNMRYCFVSLCCAISPLLSSYAYMYICIYVCLCLYVGLCALSYFIHLQASALTYSKYINASVVGGNNSILAFKYKCWQQRHDLLPLATRTTTRPHVGCDSQQQRAYQPVYCRAVWPSSFFHSCSIDVLANVGFFFGSSSVSWLKFVAFFSDVQSTYVYLSVQVALANMYLHAATFFANLYKHVYVYVCKWQRWIRII